MFTFRTHIYVQTLASATYVGQDKVLLLFAMALETKLGDIIAIKPYNVSSHIKPGKGGLSAASGVKQWSIAGSLGAAWRK